MVREIKNELANVSVFTDHFNKRIRIDDYAGSLPEVLKIIQDETPEWTEKLVIKSYSDDIPFFLSHGFTCEAYIKKYFSGRDMYFLVKYLISGRELSKKFYEEQAIVDKVLESKIESSSEEFSLVKAATKNDAEELASVYGKVFRIYPTPISDVEYIKKTMDEGTYYVCIREDGEIVSVASAEINHKYHNAELTDCATLDVAQGKGYMRKLLTSLEEKLVADGITCLYTIARAESYGMNKSFFQLGYTYGGRMINNCIIYSGLEDMNVWYKAV